jgi:hypothetical protein
MTTDNKGNTKSVGWMVLSNVRPNHAGTRKQSTVIEIISRAYEPLPLLIT